MNDFLTVMFHFSKSKKNSSAKKRVAMPNLLEDIKSGEISEIHAMPAGNDKAKVPRIPSPLPFQIESSRDNINLDYVRFRFLVVALLVFMFF